MYIREHNGRAWELRIPPNCVPFEFCLHSRICSLVFLNPNQVNGKKNALDFSAEHTNRITHANRGENSRFVVVQDKLQPPCTSNEDIISESLHGIYQWPRVVGQRAEWLSWMRTSHVKDSVVVCRILGSSVNHYFNDCDKIEAFVVERKAVTPGNWWLCWTQSLNLGSLRCQDLATPITQCVIFGKKLMEYPGIFYWISRISVYNILKSHLIESLVGAFLHFFSRQPFSIPESANVKSEFPCFWTPFCSSVLNKK